MTLGETKITGLTALNVRALNEVADAFCTTTATTATFYGPVETNLEVLRGIVASLPGRGHPKASLHAVVRKLSALGECG